MLVENITKEQLINCIEIYKKIQQDESTEKIKLIKKHTQDLFEQHYLIHLILGVKKLSCGEKIKNKSQIKAIEMYVNCLLEQLEFKSHNQENKRGI